MKRSEVNQIIDEALDFVQGRRLTLPPFSTWGISDWERAGAEYRELVDNMLGWDITDFGGGNFKACGLLIFTFRNGNFHQNKKYPKPYAEKLLLVEDGQELPFHFHWSKMEDIINRGGGNLIVQLYNSDKNEEFDHVNDVCVTIDGKTVCVPAGGSVTIRPGESITLLPRQYHRWIGEPGTGKVMLFEVSSTNDDTMDNHFYTAKQRIPELEEDVQPKYLLFKDYDTYVQLDEVIG